MRRLVDLLAGLPHRFIVSKGPRHDEYDLAPNMWGAEFLPQPAILPLVDLVITHAGNNTTTECVHHGKPMIALPLFWDQYDNAQRVDETGFGVRLRTYAFEAAELTGAIDRLLADTARRGRLAAIGAEIRSRDGVATAAAAVERVGLAGR
jgi:UDP:flavonoid glycosyltransferase YjiC (YdhE family)